MWNDLKQLLLDATGLGPNALHVVFALVIFAIALLVLRRPGLAFLAVAVIQLANEGLDAFFDIRSGQGFKLGEAIQDTAVTLAAAGLAWLVATLIRRFRRT
jgi:hypothetical protein